MAEGTAEKKGYRLKLVHLIYVIIGLIAAIVIAFVAISLLSTPSGTSAVGNGWVQVSNSQPLTVSGKLYMTFVGLEYCQFCAVERYALFNALSNFGNWSYYGNALTLTTLPVTNYTQNPEPDAIFYKAEEGDWTLNFLATELSYTSTYLDFSQTEIEDNSGNALETPTALQSSYLNKYDPGGAVPFTVIGGNFYEVGAGQSLNPGGVPIIFASNGTGYNPAYIIGEYDLNGSAINAAIQKETDYISALICFDINNVAPVCSNSAITAISSKL